MNPKGHNIETDVTVLCVLQDRGEPVLVGKPADFVVTVLDVQDTPPMFVNLPYNTEIKETATVVCVHGEAGFYLVKLCRLFSFVCICSFVCLFGSF